MFDTFQGNDRADRRYTLTYEIGHDALEDEEKEAIIVKGMYDEKYF